MIQYECDDLAALPLENDVPDLLSSPASHPLAATSALCGQLDVLVPWAVDRCRRDGHARVALYGAGTHTRLLVPRWKAAGGPEIVALIESGRALTRDCAGLRVTSAAEFDPRGVDAIVLSSRPHEAEMARACAGLWPEVPVHRIWRPLHDEPTTSLAQQPRATLGRAAANLYAEFCRTVCDTPIAPGNPWILWSFARDSPQTQQLWGAMQTVKHDLFREYVTTLTAEGRGGGVVEFGVAHGDGLAALADAVERSGTLRTVVGYDSFEGLPEPSREHDLDCWHAGDYQASVSDVRAAVEAERRPWLQLVPGWFSTTLAPGAEPIPARVALAHVDCDLYESARSCLLFLEDRLVDGAFLCFDDWTFRTHLGETKAFVEFVDRVRDRFRFEHVASLGSGACHFRVWLKPTRSA
jgi:hypothetical protein